LRWPGQRPRWCQQALTGGVGTVLGEAVIRVRGAGGRRLAAGPGSAARRPRSPSPDSRRLRPAARDPGSGGRRRRAEGSTTV